jgi:secondary thiamine-phosphate synthase enzyme
MRQAITHIEVATDRIGLVNLTEEVSEAVTASGIETGLATLFCRHTSASLIIQENADADVRADIEAWFSAAVPEGPDRYRHDEGAGPDDPPSHIRSALTAVSLGIPIESRRLVLGTWQAIFLFEHRRGGRRRQISIHMVGE